MKKISILEHINLGNAIAEYDTNIGHYYIDTAYVYDLVNDRYDIIKGVKGSGKTAMLVALCENQSIYHQLDNKVLIKAIQINGDPDFKRAFDTVSIDNTDYQKLIDAWKIYIINLVWREVKERIYNKDKLEKYLYNENIIAEKGGILNSLLHSIKRVKLKVNNTINSDGSAVQSLELSHSDTAITNKSGKIDSLIDFNFIFDELNSLLSNNDICLWIMLDRLDDAFPDNSERDNLILKSLFYAYKDICFYEGFKIKIFIREDIFDNITKENGFRSLTHVDAKTMNSIKWERDTIEQLLIERLLFNDDFVEYIKSFGLETDYTKISPDERLKIIYKFVKPQIDIGPNKPDAKGWIINHVKDGLGIYTPRDIINLFDIARNIQLNYIKEKNISDIEEEYLISPSAIREAYKKVSKDKLVAQLYAEYPKYRSWIESFRNGKAEHTENSLKSVLGKQWKSRIEKLKAIGFIEEKKNTWKIPFIYREALNISQGKAK